MNAIPYIMAAVAAACGLFLTVPGFRERWRDSRGVPALRATTLFCDGIILLCAAAFVFAMVGCKGHDSDARQRDAQEHILQEATSEVPLPSIHHFRERKLMKMLYEKRDDEDLATYTYLVASQTGALVFFCDSLGYGIPAATQMTSPEKPAYGEHGNFALPQAEPNGLFSPTDAEATWVMCKDPLGDDVQPVYVEPRVVVAPFKFGAIPERAP